MCVRWCWHSTTWLEKITSNQNDVIRKSAECSFPKRSLYNTRPNTICMFPSPPIYYMYNLLYRCTLTQIADERTWFLLFHLFFSFVLGLYPSVGKRKNIVYNLKKNYFPKMSLFMHNNSDLCLEVGSFTDLLSNSGSLEICTMVSKFGIYGEITIDR